jgi:hypothetical protein
MKNLFAFAMALMLMAFGVAYAQTTGQPTLPPSQQVDQSGQPETGTGVDVDVDAGRNAEDGLVDVDVNSTTDSDTAAEGNDTTGTMSTTGGTGVRPETETGSGVDVDVDTGARANGAVDVDVSRTTDADTDASGIDETGSLDRESTATAGDADALPGTASELPAVALLGLLALAAAFTVRFFRS